MDKRTRLSHKYLKGSGIEIGGLHFPLEVLPGAKVSYIDRMTLDELRKECPDVTPKSLEIIVDDGEVLHTVLDDSQDFVIANHVFEHCQNPILTLENWFRVLKSGGIIYAAIPDKRETFDRDRQVTSYEHIIRDYEEGPAWSQRDHYVDWYTHADHTPKDQIEQRVEDCMKNNQNIHFHVWDTHAMQDMFVRLSLYGAFDIVEFTQNGGEVIWILRKK